jgi:hypothetical protein
MKLIHLALEDFAVDLFKSAVASNIINKRETSQSEDLRY